MHLDRAKLFVLAALLAGAVSGCRAAAPAGAPVLAPAVVSAPDSARAPAPVSPPAAAPLQAVRGPHEGDREYTLGGSGASDNDFDTGGGTVAGSVGWFLTDRSELGVRQSLSYSDFGDSVWNGSTRLFYDWHFGNGSVRPLIGANLGYVYGDTVEETAEAAPEVGLKWYATESAFVFALVEYQFFFDSADEADDTFDDGSFVYTVGIGIDIP